MKHRLQRFGLPIVAFLLVGGGALAALPRADSDPGGAMVPTLVAVSDMPAGMSVNDVRSRVEVREVASDDRVPNALASLDDIPSGVLAYAHVSGQPILATSFAENRIDAVKKGYVAISLRLETQRWFGPLTTSGSIVNVYDIAPTGVQLVSRNAVVIDAPSTGDIGPKDDTVLALAVDPASLADVLRAADQGRIWLVGS